MIKAFCTRTDANKVAAILANKGKVQPPTASYCPACSKPWDSSHLLVYVDIPGARDEEERQRRQISIIMLEMAEDNFLKAHGWTREGIEFIPPKNYRFRKSPLGTYTRSHAVNSQRQVYNPRYEKERQWESDVAWGDKNEVRS
jgi:hypothetical protein